LGFERFPARKNCQSALLERLRVLKLRVRLRALRLWVLLLARLGLGCQPVHARHLLERRMWRQSGQ
jgi:hypothetical protein